MRGPAALDDRTDCRLAAAAGLAGAAVDPERVLAAQLLDVFDLVGLLLGETEAERGVDGAGQSTPLFRAEGGRLALRGEAGAVEGLGGVDVPQTRDPRLVHQRHLQLLAGVTHR